MNCLKPPSQPEESNPLHHTANLNKPNSPKPAVDQLVYPRTARYPKLHLAPLPTKPDTGSYPQAEKSSPQSPAPVMVDPI
jgi:hypothetical protein